MQISADFLQKRACRPADFGSQRLRHSAENTEKRQNLQKSRSCLQNIKSDCTEGVFWFTITSAGREARKEKITMEKSVIPCGASPQEWRYIDALGADCRYIVPIVSAYALEFFENFGGIGIFVISGTTSPIIGAE